MVLSLKILKNIFQVALKTGDYSMNQISSRRDSGKNPAHCTGSIIVLWEELITGR
jgi:hypothetical protein